MLLILFRIGDQPHALDVTQVETVAPALPLRAIPGAPRGVMGVFEHHGRMIPVVDLALAVTGQPARPLLSSRFIIVKADEHTLALLAEQVTDTLEVPDEKLQNPGVKSADAPFLGEIFRDEDGAIVQCISPQSVLPPEVLASLDLQPVEAP